MLSGLASGIPSGPVLQYKLIYGIRDEGARTDGYRQPSSLVQARRIPRPSDPETPEPIVEVQRHRRRNRHQHALQAFPEVQPIVIWFQSTVDLLQ